MVERNFIRSEQVRPQTLARLGGALYLMIIVIGVLGQVVIRGSLIVFGDAAATAQRITESEFLWRLGIAGQLVLLMFAVTLTLIFYLLLRPVNRNLALLAVFFGLISLSVEAVSGLSLQAALLPLSSAEHLKAIDPEQLHLLAYLSVASHADSFGLALVFFGVECVIVGYLIRKSGYLPKAIGVLMQIAGLCYLINSFSLVLHPSFANVLFPWILLPAFVGESSFCLWLLLKGVNIPKWQRALDTH